MPFTPEDHAHMRLALDLAERGRGRVEPNPMVGAVVVKGGRVLGKGRHARYGGPHAEPTALEAARLNAGDTTGATLYCTLEPCAHHGKTPPCAPAVVRAGIARVVIAVEEPLWERQAGAETRRGLAVLRDAGVEVEVGLLAEEAVVMNAAFFKCTRTGMPLVIAKWAMTADGRSATRTGHSRWISGDEARRLVHELRGRVDAVVVGAGTALADDPDLTCRDAETCRTAARVVLCGRRTPPTDSRLVRTAGEAPVLLAHVDGRAPEGLDAVCRAGCEALALPALPNFADRPDPSALLAALRERGASNVLVEGGAATLGSFLDAGLVDRVMTFVAPVIVGDSDARPAVAGRGVDTMDLAPRLCRSSVRQVGADALIEGWAVDPLRWRPEPWLPNPPEQT